MGADGHVEIYDYHALRDRFDKEVLDSFFDHFLSGKMYAHQVLKGEWYVTRYYGDNYQSDDMYDVVYKCYDAKKHVFDTKHYYYSPYEAEYFLDLPKDVRSTFCEIINFMESEARITSWEVWT